MMRLLVLLALVLAADLCSDENACNHLPTEVGGVVTQVQASTDPCVGQPPLHVVAWFAQRSIRYPSRCGKRAPKRTGYLHIRYDEGGHGDPANDPTFSAEMANTLAGGVEAAEGGGNYRYTVKYGEAKSACYRGAWGFRVVLA